MTSDGRPCISILGARGLPAKHGGFETFLERLAPWLVQRGWRVRVFCQDETGKMQNSLWKGVELVQIPVRTKGSLGSIEFDWRSVMRAVADDSLVLTLGYNTAMIGVLYRFRDKVNVVNMDGLEWKREKWSWPARAWLWMNEQAAIRLSDHIIADHPVIAERMERFASRDRITMIPYGADPIIECDLAPLVALDLEPRRFAVTIARIEKENQIIEIVRAFSRKPRGIKLVVLGILDPAHSSYHAAVRAAAGPEVIFPGPIYDPEMIRALRLNTRFYFHGHHVGGTNPSLVEALGAGSPILAHDNPFNRWVGGDAPRYFTDEDSLDAAVSHLVAASPEALAALSEASRARHDEAFHWEPVLEAYERLLIQLLPHPYRSQFSRETAQDQESLWT